VEDTPRQFVIFRIGEEEYGLPIPLVSSIVRHETATPVPRAPVEVEGVINLRGRVIPVVDLGRRMGGRPFEPTPLSRIVVTQSDLGDVGLEVDEANEVSTIDPDDIKPTPESALTPETAEMFEGVANHEGRLIILLRLERAIPREYATIAAQEGEDDV
jgi:purine-binding chemotaxis protein CheW